MEVRRKMSDSKATKRQRIPAGKRAVLVTPPEELLRIFDERAKKLGKSRQKVILDLMGKFALGLIG
jgi:hypothetical protein